MKTYISSEMSRFLSSRQSEECLDWTYYDFYHDARRREFRLFSRALSGDICYEQTNMDYASMLCQGKRFGLFSLDFQVGFRDVVGRPVGSCPKCGAPITDSKACAYCSSPLPAWANAYGAIHGNYELRILDKTYCSGKINGPIHRRELTVPIPIPEQCVFQILVTFDREVDRFNAVMNGILIRSAQ